MLFLYNPTAGKGRVTADLAAVLDVFTKAGYLTTVYPTQGKADATRIAAELGGQFDRVVCSGGDGTLSETVSGLMQLDHPPVLGYIPFGSTNDCATTLRLPRDPVKAAADSPQRPAFPAPGISAGSTAAPSSMWPLSAPSPRCPTTPPRI